MIHPFLALEFIHSYIMYSGRLRQAEPSNTGDVIYPVIEVSNRVCTYFGVLTHLIHMHYNTEIKLFPSLNAV